MNTYKAFYNRQQIEVTADTSFEAQNKAAIQLKAKKRWEVSVVLVAKEGEIVTHRPQDICP